jgi:hypothetical protein
VGGGVYEVEECYSDAAVFEEDLADVYGMGAEVSSLYAQ